MTGDINGFKFELNVSLDLEECKPKKKLLSRRLFYHFDGENIHLITSTTPGVGRQPDNGNKHD